MKKLDFFIHIGLPKTGTTALQSSLRINEDYLQKLGIYAKEDIYIYSSDLFSSENALNKIDNIAMSMVNIAHKNKCNKIVESNEGSFLFFVSKEIPKTIITIRKLKKFFSNFNVKIVCYLRRQDFLIESLFNEYIKTASSSELLMDLQDNKSNPIFDYVFQGNNNLKEFYFYCKNTNAMMITDYYNILSVWANIVGKENLLIRPYEKQQLQKGTVYDFYHSVLDLTDEQIDKLEKTINTNEKMSRDLIEYKIYSKFFLAEDSYIINKLMDTKEDNQTYFTDAERFRLLEYHKEGNEKIAKEWLHHTDGILFYEKIEKMEPYSGLTIDKTLLIVKKLIARRLFEREKKIILTKLFNAAFKLNKSITIYGANAPNIEIVFEVIFNINNLPNKIANVTVVDECTNREYYSYYGMFYEVYKYKDLTTLSPDIILIASEIDSGLEILKKLNKLHLRNTLFYPMYDFADDIWCDYIPNWDYVKITDIWKDIDGLKKGT